MCPALAARSNQGIALSYSLDTYNFMAPAQNIDCTLPDLALAIWSVSAMPAGALWRYSVSRKPSAAAVSAMSAHKKSGRRSMRIVGLRQVRPQICRIVLMVEKSFTASNLKGDIQSAPGGNDRALRLLMTPSAVNLLTVSC